MGCPTIPLSCLDPSKIFAGLYKPNCAGFADPSNFKAERTIFNSQFGEQINNFGTEIGYYVNNFNMEKMNSIYGEQTTMYWLGPVTIKAYVQLNEQSPMYALAGFDSPDTITAYFHIDTFTRTMSGLSAYSLPDYPVEPRAQDKIIVWPLGCDRVNGRGAKIFEVTEVLDQDTSELNPIMGHYVWRVKGVRSEFNSTTNEPRELENNQMSDTSFFGKLSSTMFPELTGGVKKYTEYANEVVKTQIFPPSTGGSDGSVYGNYY